MKTTLITNIKQIVGIDNGTILRKKGEQMAVLNTANNAWLLIEDDKIARWGTITDPLPHADNIINAQEGMLLPTFCDSHTHIVFAGSREHEFVDKIRGLSYEEIAKRGGGILNSADLLHETSEDDLYEQSLRRLNEVISKGTGALEIKSGYGLNLEDELKMLRVIARLKGQTRAQIKTTFLCAHAVSRPYRGRQAEYVDYVVNEMIPEVGKQGLADYIDVFCDKGFFTPEETGRMLTAGAQYGLRGKIHGQELADSGGVDIAVAHNALSVDHLEAMTDRDIETLQASETMPTALPGTSFFLNMPFAPGRQMIDKGLSMAIASDYNPGSTPSGDMRFVVSLACIKMRLLPSEAINAATINSAYALGLSQKVGSIAPGKIANFILTQSLPSIDFIPYAYTSPWIQQVWLAGEKVTD